MNKPIRANKHTPGPWRVGCDLTRICTNFRDTDGRVSKDNYQKGGWAKTIAKMTDPKWAAPLEQFYNAKLIAAAPELVEVLKINRETWVHYRDEHGAPEADVMIDFIDQVFATAGVEL